MTARGRNRLDEEASPYLRQHADNPVHWQPWDEDALAEARERDAPIFLSIGYSACHWCHVMEEESFQNEDIAAVLNDSFVPIKVDREERPDVDSVYMTVCQLVTGRGGWPLSAWLTPEGKPFYVGTYFPPEPRQGMPSFEQLCEDIAASWNDPEQRGEIERRAEQWTDAAADELEETPDRPGALDPDEDLLRAAADAAVRAADREHGGFGSSGPKFPQPGRLHLLTRAFDRTGRDAYRDVVAETLDGMADNGLYDHLGGGFHRYATDRSWTVPHFEKMLYDQAELVRAYLAGYQLTGTERYADVAVETLAFVERELTHPDGGFYSTLDARSAPPEGWPAGESSGGGAAVEGDATSEGDADGADERDADAAAEPLHDEEGAFYVWTPAQVRAALDADADLFCERFGVTEAGNFEHGTTVLTLSATVEELAAERDADEGALRDRLEELRLAAFRAREDRPHPRRDDKVLAGWNGLMISAFAEAGLVVDADLTSMAADALSFVRDRLWDDGEGRLHRRYRDGDVAVPGYLEDYAFLGRGAFDLYQATGDVEHLAFALDLARVVEAEFWDADRGTLYLTPESGERLVARPQSLDDSSTPAATGVAAQLLADLSPFAPDAGFDEVADAVLATHADRIRSNPLQHASLTLAADARRVGALELTVAADGLPEAWRERLAETYLPYRLLTVRPPTDEALAPWLDALGLDEAPPVWAGRTERDGEPTVYACRSFTCSPPQHDLDEALSWAERLAPGGGESGAGEPGGGEE